MAVDEIRITLETLYDILRNEKKKEDLQKLEATFFIDVVSYLREKNALLESKAQEKNIFASGERDKLEYELRSIKRILKEIYEKREKKIMDIALNKSRTGSDIIDISAMLLEEKEFYHQLLDILNSYRKGIIHRLFQAQLPEIHTESKPREIASSIPNTFARFQNAVEAENDDDTPASSTTEKASAPALTKIRFLHPMPSFIWKDMKVYGPFNANQETNIFPEVADLIVRKGRAVKV